MSRSAKAAEINRRTGSNWCRYRCAHCAIAGRGKGAAVGAGVGGGTATAIQVLTKGEKLNIPSETKLEFTLRAPLVVAAR